MLVAAHYHDCAAGEPSQKNVTDGGGVVRRSDGPRGRPRAATVCEWLSAG